MFRGGGAWKSFIGDSFSLDAFMASQADGLYYDFTKTDRHFQESIGPTLADDIDEPIGLALDQRTWRGQTLQQVVAAQAELLTNGSFSSGLTGWTNLSAGTGTATVTDGQLTVTRVDASNIGWVTQQIAVTAGRTYQVKATRVSGSGTALRVGTTSGGNELYDATLGIGTTVRYIAATTAALHVNLRGSINDTTTVIDNVSVKEVPGRHATQATGASRPSRQSDGAHFDGGDDVLLAAYRAGASKNFIAARFTAPAVVGATQVIVGASSSLSCYLGITTAGKLAAGVGSDSTTTIVGGGDIRGLEVTAALSFNGSTVTLFLDDAVVYSGPQNGLPVTTVPFHIGARNSSGTPANFFSGAVKKLLVGQEFLTLQRYLQIKKALLS